MTKRRSISISDDTWRRVRLLAIELNLPPSRVVEEICRVALDQRDAKKGGQK